MRGTVGGVNAAPGCAALGPTVLAEGAAAAAAAGYPLLSDEHAAGTAAVTRAGPPPAPSMYRDIVAGRPTEVEHVFADRTAPARARRVEMTWRGSGRVAVVTADGRDYLKHGKHQLRDVHERYAAFFVADGLRVSDDDYLAELAAARASFEPKPPPSDRSS
ncbi:ketopantoate reductase C-terminal domain-containing protein [Streptomyces sp. NPDC093589]|uniref:ketopantoate reductase C-terminal domain-containing protein n=1 Tax=Streptomyces sp. NPDC093589 TaxID=3366043 RepID=UPI00382DA5BB